MYVQNIFDYVKGVVECPLLGNTDPFCNRLVLFYLAFCISTVLSQCMRPFPLRPFSYFIIFYVIITFVLYTLIQVFKSSYIIPQYIKVDVANICRLSIQ